MPLRNKPQNTIPRGISAGRLTPQGNTLQADTASKVPSLTQNFSLSQNLKEKRMPLENSSNANIYTYVSLRNFSSFNWKVSNTNTENEPLFCYLYGSTNGSAGTLNDGDVELIQRVEANETMNINVPIRSHYYRAEYAIAGDSNVSVKANVSTIPFQVYSNDQPIYKSFQQYDIGALVRQSSRWESDVIRGNYLGSSITSHNVLITDVSNTTGQLAWDTTSNYTRLPQAFPMLVQSTDANDDALQIFISGLDNNGDSQSETLTLTDAVSGETTTKSYWKVNEARVVGGTLGVQYFNTGNISVSYDAGGSLFTQEFIPAGASQSSTIKYAVPSTKAVVVRNIKIKGVLDDTFELRVIKYNELTDNTIRYESLALTGETQGTELTTYPLNLFLPASTEFAVVIVAGSGTTNKVNISAVWEEYDNQVAVETPIA